MSRRNIGVELDLEVVMTDGTSYRVTTNVQDQIRWEVAHNGEAWIRSVAAGSHSQMLETAFYALKRTGQIERTELFERWVYQVAELYSHDGEDDEDEGPSEEGPGTF